MQKLYRNVQKYSTIFYLYAHLIEIWRPRKNAKKISYRLPRLTPGYVEELRRDKQIFWYLIC
jgi:hypothetical protein